jgi:hypothetical protein
MVEAEISAPVAPTTVEVEASRYWTDSGFAVRKGEVLHFVTEGGWWDAHYESGPGGYDAPWWMSMWEGLRRCPEARWFELAGEIGKGNGVRFPIGNRGAVTMPADGHLFLYANDVPGFYFNNRGAIWVTIWRANEGQD